MDFLEIYFIIAAVLTQQALTRPDWNGYDIYDSQGHHQYYHGAQALHIIRHDGFLADTYEVAAAKEAHLAAVAAHSHHDSYLYADHTGHHIVHEHKYVKPYHGPIALPVVLPSGYLADTPEVAVAKIHHLAAVAQAKADKYYSGQAGYGYGGAFGYSGSHQGYGIPVVLPSGHIADTHEVASAKSAHLLAVAKAKADKYYTGFGEGYGYGGDYGYSGSYHGYGIPVVLPNGHLADTPEVAAAKSAHITAVAHAKAEQAHSDYHHTDHIDDYVHHEAYLPHHEDQHEVNHIAHYQPEYIQHYEPHHTLHHKPLYVPYNHANVWFHGR